MYPIPEKMNQDQGRDQIVIKGYQPNLTPVKLRYDPVLQPNPRDLSIIYVTMV